MSDEKANKKVMYWVLKSLWFTKEPVYFVAMMEGIYIVKFGNIKDRTRILNLAPWLFNNCLFAMLPYVQGQKMEDYVFHIVPFWIRVYNIPFERMDKQVAIDVREVVEEKCLQQNEIPDADKSNFQYGNWLRVHHKIRLEEALGEYFTFEGDSWQSAPPRIMKILCWNYHGIGDLVIVCKLKQLLVVNSPNIVFLCETKIYAVKLESIRVKCWMAGYLGIDLEGYRVGLAVMSKDGIEVTIQNYSSQHIDLLVKLDDFTSLRFIGSMGRKPRDEVKDPTLLFKIEACWAYKKEAKDLIKRAWGTDNNVIKGMKRINRLIDRIYMEFNIDILKVSRSKLNRLYMEEQRYWAEKSHIQ
ncbi:hypothetical protein CXB51_003846 [Gossypium anomalum]|uniref:DUF4283 domain-containing protein n=1 Tax=Gossypium anomalum TaxID=47600 RepID=A0A8J6DAT5_9ROSI|nr:hypothetical protein CXB51_003846 [Gossypium anomalum]